MNEQNTNENDELEDEIENEDVLEDQDDENLEDDNSDEDGESDDDLEDDDLSQYEGSMYLPDEDEDEDEEEEEGEDENELQEEESEDDGSIQDEDENEDEAEEDSDSEDEEKVITSNGLESYAQIEKQSEDTFKQRYGVEYNEFEPGHKDALGDIKKVVRKRSKADNEGLAIIKANGGAKFQEFLLKENKSMTVGEAEQIAEAELRGDFSLSLEYLKKAAKKYNNSGKARDKANKLNKEAKNAKRSTNRKGNPPKTISTGTGSARGKRSNTSDMLSPEELGLGKEIDLS